MDNLKAMGLSRCEALAKRREVLGKCPFSCPLDGNVQFKLHLSRFINTFKLIVEIILYEW